MFPESETENQRLKEYSKAIQTICVCLVISVILIVLFVISPLKNMFYSIIGKLACIALLGFALYKNIIITNNTQELEKSYQISSYVLSLFILILILSVIRKMFIKSVDRPMVAT